MSDISHSYLLGLRLGHDMAQKINKLTARTVANLKDGLLSDGGGLYLNASGGGRRWVYIWRTGGRRREMGLGAAADISLAAARELAAAARSVVVSGGDPIEARLADRAERQAASSPMPTFGEFAEDYIASVEDGWKNAVHRQQWRQSLRDHAGAITKKPLNDITTDDLLAVLRPIWLSKPQTASRLRGRIEKILDAAKAKGLRPRDMMNPATWRGHLALLLPRQAKLTRGHHAALPYAGMPAFWASLQMRPALAARCLQFTILTAARSGEALGATWAEIDAAAKIWTVPASRMKAGVEHSVPLSKSAIQVLQSVRPDHPKPSDLVFAVGGAARSNMAMTMLLRRMGHGDVTVHGFRSSFRDWAGDATHFPREIVEQALAHTIGDEAERAYRRGTAIERRRTLMDAWADCLSRAASNVFQLPGVEAA